MPKPGEYCRRCWGPCHCTFDRELGKSMWAVAYWMDVFKKEWRKRLDDYGEEEAGWIDLGGQG